MLPARPRPRSYARRHRTVGSTLTPAPSLGGPFTLPSNPWVSPLSARRRRVDLPHRLSPATNRRRWHHAASPPLWGAHAAQRHMARNHGSPPGVGGEAL